MTSPTGWDRFQEYYLPLSGTGIALDISRMNFPASFWQTHAAALENALQHMRDLEGGAIANPDEQRRVGHYWLRDPERAPNAELRDAIHQTRQQVNTFAAKVRKGDLANEQGEPFRHVLVIGIGGSALGPQFVDLAMRAPLSKIQLHFLDNTDPDGFESVFAALHNELARTLCIVISKSGSTAETRNAMLETQHIYQAAGLNFASHAIAVTSGGSQLEQLATEQAWLATFPMWDWVGGRTSEFSAVGLLPAALQGVNLDAMLAGAKAMDEHGRNPNPKQNPAAQLALMWWYAGNGRGDKAMVVLPYKDRLLLFSRYLQQLVMESIGKAHNLSGDLVEQGLSVYGNKGSTDQHAYVQQLRDGRNDFFVVFLEVLKDRRGEALEVEEDVTSGDYLLGFLLGTRQALHEQQRESITLTLDEVSPQTVGALVALFERAVGIYAHLIGINAYHQPGVEAGKKAAGDVLALQTKLLAQLRSEPQRYCSLEELAAALDVSSQTETLFKLLEHLAANERVQKQAGATPFAAKYAAPQR